MNRNSGHAATLAERLWQHVRRGPGCWEWQGYVTAGGQGQLFRPGHGKGRVQAHRAAWEVTHGLAPRDIAVRQRCGNLRCCNPDHLYLLPWADIAHRPVGASNGRAKLTRAQVDEIVSRYRPGSHPRLRAGTSASELAAEFGVTSQYIGALARGLFRRSA